MRYTQLLFSEQSTDFAFNGVNAVTNRLSKNEVAPLYLPNSDLPPVKITFDTEPDTSETDQLRSLKVLEVELLVPAQKDDSLNLGKLFGNDRPTDGAAIINKRRSSHHQQDM